MRFEIVVAMDLSRAIGKDNELPWYLPDDLKNFKSLTVGGAVLMGRKTYQSIHARLGGPLPDRLNLVVSEDQGFVTPSDVLMGRSIAEAVGLAANAGFESLHVIGGASLYNQLLSQSTILHVTTVNAKLGGDTFFPEIPPNRFRVTKTSPVHPIDDRHPFSFVYRRYAQKGAL